MRSAQVKLVAAQSSLKWESPWAKGRVSGNHQSAAVLLIVQSKFAIDRAPTLTAPHGNDLSFCS